MKAKILQTLITIVIIASSGGVAWILVNNKPEVKKVEREKVIPVVKMVVATQKSHDITLQTQGEIESIKTSTLSAEVGGSILKVSPQFELGGIFKAGDIMLEIDPVDYQTALVRAQTSLIQAKASVTRAKVELELEETRATQAKRDWEKLGRSNTPSNLFLRKPQIKSAKSALASAEASVIQAESDIEQALRQVERTKIKAPYPCQILRKRSELGSLAIPGQPLVEIEEVGRSQVRFPIALEDVTLMPSLSSDRDIQVHASAIFGGQKKNWTGRLKRKEERIDSASRSFYYTAEFTNEQSPPVGLFVEIQLKANSLPKAYKLPRSALRAESNVLIIDEESTLQFKAVNVLRSDTNSVYIDSGLVDGDRICVTALDTAIAGMEVSIKPSTASSQ